MPLSVEIKVNGKPITTLHIARMAALSRTTGLYRYSALLRDAPEITREKDWDEGIMFAHSIGDGVLACVEKAIQAVNADE